MSSDEDTDALIDDTAKGMTAGSPSTALRDTVRARMLSPRAWWQVQIWQPALGAVAVALAMLIVSRPAVELAPTAVMPAAEGLQATPVAGRPQPSGRVEGGAATVAENPANASPARSAAPPRITPVELAAFATVPEEEVSIDPLAIEPIPTLIASVEAIPDPMPLRIDALEIRPLSEE